MTHTRYTMANTIRLVVGLFISIMITAVFAFGWGGPVKDFHSLCQALFANASCLVFFAFIAMFRWSGLGAIILWSITALSFVFSLLSGDVWDTFMITFWIAVISTIASWINSESKEEGSVDQTSV